MGDSAPYRAIRVTIWHDEKFFTLSDDGQLVSLFSALHKAQQAAKS